MSRSVSAPSSVTNTSPCWNGLIVPGSTFRYGSNFWSWTRRPRAFSRRPSEAATIPLPSAETTPPVTNTYFGARALTGFQCSSDGGRTSLGGRGLNEVVEAPERKRRERAPQHEPRRVDDELDAGAVVPDPGELQLGLDPLVHELEGEPSSGNDVGDEENA